MIILGFFATFIEVNFLFKLNTNLQNTKNNFTFLQ